MRFTFYKYQGTGNDFVIFDNRDGRLPSANQQLYNQLCDRRFGIGSDGLMLLENAPGYDFKMVYFNADGTQSSMCGNGGRCLVSFARSLDLFENETNFLAVDGPHYAKISDNTISLQMVDVKGVKKLGDDYTLNTGSPHYVRFVKEVDSLNIFHLGREIRYADEYRAEGINVNFVQELNPASIYVRTYERGVEDETYSCGTGVTAAALALSFKHNMIGSHRVSIKTKGGDLDVSFERDDNAFHSVFLTGPAEFVFKGEIDIDLTAY